MFWRRNQAVLQASEATNTFLIRARIEKANIQRFFFTEFWQIDGRHVLFAVVIIITITSQSAQKYPFIFIVPSVYGQHYEFFAYCPSIWQGCDEGGIDHIPLFTVVLLFLVENFINGATAFAHGETAKFGKNMWYGNFRFGTANVYLV